jgi:uncharacterized protein YegL
MAWTSYREDIISRYVAGRAARKKSSISIKWKEVKLSKLTGSNDRPSPAKIKAPKMSKLKEFTVSAPRPLPIMLLADVSGSMSVNGKIDVLNQAVVEMVESLKEEDDSRADIQIGVITFGQGGARLHQPLLPVGQVHWKPMEAAGRTPLGGALETVTQIVEDREQIPSRAYTPTLILVSDGQPTDEWEKPLEALRRSDRASKAFRFAMGIGDDADTDMLNVFLRDTDARVFEASQARHIKQFFRWVTMSVTARSHSINPNQAVVIEPTDLDDFEF